MPRRPTILRACKKTSTAHEEMAPVADNTGTASTSRVCQRAKRNATEAPAVVPIQAGAIPSTVAPKIEVDGTPSNLAKKRKYTMRNRIPAKKTKKAIGEAFYMKARSNEELRRHLYYNFMRLRYIFPQIHKDRIHEHLVQEEGVFAKAFDSIVIDDILTTAPKGTLEAARAQMVARIAAEERETQRIAQEKSKGTRSRPSSSTYSGLNIDSNAGQQQQPPTGCTEVRTATMAAHLQTAPQTFADCGHVARSQTYVINKSGPQENPISWKAPMMTPAMMRIGNIPPRMVPQGLMMSSGQHDSRMLSYRPGSQHVPENMAPRSSHGRMISGVGFQPMTQFRVAQETGQHLEETYAPTRYGETYPRMMPRIIHSQTALQEGGFQLEQHIRPILHSARVPVGGFPPGMMPQGGMLSGRQAVQRVIQPNTALQEGGFHLEQTPPTLHSARIPVGSFPPGINQQGGMLSGEMSVPRAIETNTAAQVGGAEEQKFSSTLHFARIPVGGFPPGMMPQGGMLSGRQAVQRFIQPNTALQEGGFHLEQTPPTLHSARIPVGSFPPGINQQGGMLSGEMPVPRPIETNTAAQVGGAEEEQKFSSTLHFARVPVGGFPPGIMPQGGMRAEEGAEVEQKFSQILHSSIKSERNLSPQMQHVAENTQQPQQLMPSVTKKDRTFPYKRMLPQMVMRPVSVRQGKSSPAVAPVAVTSDSLPGSPGLAYLAAGLPKQEHASPTEPASASSVVQQPPTQQGTGLDDASHESQLLEEISLEGLTLLGWAVKILNQ